MKILQVVTLTSPDGAYGGPMRVAEQQCRELRARGHDVTIMAAHRGYREVPKEIAGTSSLLYPAVQLIPKIGFAGISSPGLFFGLARIIKSFDVVHIHLARDLVTLPAALLCMLFKVPFVTQTHGMIDPSNRRLANLLDWLLTRKVLRSAKRVFWLTPSERQSLGVVTQGQQLALQELRNGIPQSDHGIDGRHVTDGVEVLYLARLHRRKRPRLLAEVAQGLLAKGHQFTLKFVGPDEGEATALVEWLGTQNESSRVSWEGAAPPDATLDRMRKADIYVLPSLDEPFPMSVLEAMSVGLPVIVTDTCGLAPYIQDGAAGLVVDGTQSSLESALRELVEDRELRRTMGRRGLELVTDQFSITKVVDDLEGAYEFIVFESTDGKVYI